MPQMAPLNWLSLFLLFLLIFMIFNIMNYYIFFYNMKTFKKIKAKLNYNWKW
uniref:ATP synthase complex subunit 8 n=1 Tax=Lamiinae sp. 2 ACP-2013 TaxID=1434532 RepID=A0A3G5FNF5_9CUCU|nr:ATP synthase F0 subunit 8 [Lamiinae sp. 2 ACP-2013]